MAFAKAVHALGIPEFRVHPAWLVSEADYNAAVGSIFFTGTAILVPVFGSAFVKIVVANSFGKY